MIIYKHKDPDGDRIAVFDADIEGPGYDLGPGVNIRTDPSGSSITDAEIPNLIKALQEYLDK